MNTTAYGFAIAARWPDLQLSRDFRRVDDGGVSQVTAHGVEIAVRHYSTTPESVSEEQPLVGQDTILAYEGRVDNRNEIAVALGQPHIAHVSDGAVLAAAYEAWGPNLSANVVGEYAFVVFDRRERRFVAGQDSLGVRRIWYRALGERVWITSNLRLLFEQFPEARPPFDREVMREYFAGTLSPWSGRTIWRGIRELNRGRVLIQRGPEVEERVAWQPASSRPTRFKSADELDEAFRKLLFDGVRHALRSPRPLLADLSGGCDSSTTCSLAALLTRAGHGHHGIIGWSTISARSHERELQEAVRAQYDIELHALKIESHLPFQAFDDSELPSGGFIQCGAMNRAMREFARLRGLRSRMTGHGADALLQKGFPPPVYLAEWLRTGRVRDWARHFAGYLKGGHFSAWHLLRDCSVGTLDLHAGQFRMPLPDWLTTSFREEIRQASHDFLQAHHRTFSSEARERVYRFTLCFIPEHGRLLPDERMPLVYRPLVEFLLGLDWEHLAKPGEDRLLMRRALRGILPEAVRTGRANGRHGASIYEGLRAAWPRIGHLLTGEQLADLGVVERKPFRLALETMRAGYDGPNSQVSKTALYLETWLSLKANSLNHGTTMETSLIRAN